MDQPRLNLDLFREKKPEKVDASPSTSFPVSSSSLHLDNFRAASIVPKNVSFFDPSVEVETVKRLRGEGKTYKEIEQLTHIPSSTANDLVLKPSLRHGEIGRTLLLSDARLQKELHEKVLEKTLEHKPPTAVEVAELAGQILSSPGHSVHPSTSWARSFAAQHPEEYTFSIPKALEKERANVDDADILVSWHDDMEKKLHPSEVPASLTFNMDELKLEVSESKRGRVLVPRGFTKPSRSKEPKSTPEHITIALLSSADPSVNRILRHLVILPLKNIPNNLLELNDIFDFSGNPGTGWTNQSIFNAQMQSVVDQIVKIRLLKGFPVTARAILWLDADTSRRCPEAMQHLAQNNVQVGGLLSHTTTDTQPLDGGIIGSVKQKASSRLRSIQPQLFPNKSIADLTMGEKRLLYLKSFRDGIRETFSVDDRIKTAWAQASLYPFNRDVLFKTEDQKRRPLDRSRLDKIMTPIPGQRIPIHGLVLTDEKTYVPLWDEQRRRKAPNSSSDKKKPKKVSKRKKPKPSLSSSSDESEEPSLEDLQILKIGKNSNKIVKEPRTLNRKRARPLSDEEDSEQPIDPSPDIVEQSINQIQIPIIPLKDIRHAEDDLLFFADEDGKRNRRLDSWMRQQKSQTKAKK